MSSDLISSGWKTEIIELHDVFQAYFGGVIDSLERVDAALADDFSIVGASGAVSSRSATMSALQAGHGHADSLRIRTLDHRLLVETNSMLVAEYVEEHELPSGSSYRLSTVVFSRSQGAPNGLLWHRVHETWVDRD